MVYLSVPARFDHRQVESAIRLNDQYRKNNIKIESFFGNLNPSEWTSARYLYNLPSVIRPQLKKYISSIHKSKLEFEYTLNSPYLARNAYFLNGKKKITDFIKSLVDINIDSVCVANFMLMGIIANNFPKLKLNVSTVAEIKEAHQIRQLKYFKIDTLIPSCSVNRDINSLKEIIKEARKNKIKLKLLVNNNCLYNCIYTSSHYNFIGLFNRIMKAEDFKNDYFASLCFMDKIYDVTNILKSPLIRPEDIKYYKNLGVNFFKLPGRSCSEELNLENVKIYMERNFTGNFFDLWSRQQNSIWSKLFYLENKELKNSINHYLDKNQYAKEINRLAKKVRINKKLQKELSSYYHRTLQRNFKKYPD